MLCDLYYVDVYGLGFTANKPLINKLKKWRTTVPSAARTFRNRSSISSLLTARGGALSTGFIRLAHAQFEYLISTKSPVTPDELRTAYIFR